MVDAIRKPRVREVPLSEVKDDLSRFLREAEKQDIVITSPWQTSRSADRL